LGRIQKENTSTSSQILVKTDIGKYIHNSVRYISIMSENLNKPNYEELNELINIIAKTRAAELEIPAEETLLLDNLLEYVSINGSMPRWMGKAPKDLEKDDVVMYIEGTTREIEDLEPTRAYIQWGNQTNVKCIHLGFLGVNFTILKNSEVIFNHEGRRNLSEEEIRTVSNVFKRTTWSYPQYKNVSDILAEDNSKRPS
jgi:hypothetical protein